MAPPPKTVKMTLLTIVAASELQDRLLDNLRTAGAHGYTFMQAGGGGAHGIRRRGIWEIGNVRIESLVSPEVAAQVLGHVEKDYEGQSVIAFVQEVQAAPHAHFVDKS